MDRVSKSLFETIEAIALLTFTDFPELRLFENGSPNRKEKNAKRQLLCIEIT